MQGKPIIRNNTPWSIHGVNLCVVLSGNDCAHRLRREVHQDAVDALSFAGDPVGDLVEDLAGDLLDGCGHSVLGVNSADSGGPAFVTALVLHADTHDVRNCDEILPDFSCQTVLIAFLAQNRMGFPQGVQTVTGKGTQTACRWP